MASMGFTPALKDDWFSFDHSTDPDPGVVGINSVLFASQGPTRVRMHGVGSCTGTATDGAHTAQVTGVKFRLTRDPAHLGGSFEATCSSLFADPPPPPVAENILTINWQASGAEIAPTVVTDTVFDPTGTGLATTGGAISGSFAGGRSSTRDNFDAVALGDITQAQPTSANPTPSYPRCQPGIVIKEGGFKASLRAPRGLSRAAIVTGSTLDITADVPGPTAYVSDFSGNVVTPFDIAAGTVGFPISVQHPLTIAVTPDGRTAYVSTLTGVTPIDTATNTPEPTIAVPGSPGFVAITPDGATAYVAENGGRVSPIDTATNVAGPPITVGPNPGGIAVTPNGETAYVTDRQNGTVTPISTATNVPGVPIHVGNDPYAIAVTPSGGVAYVTNRADGTVTPINTATNTAGTAISVGASPEGIVITPNGATAYVKTLAGITPISTATNIAGTPIALSSSPRGVALTPDGSNLYVMNELGTALIPINTGTNKAGTPIGGFPQGSEDIGIARSKAT
jgi:YVTN family beta-propeller protein